MPDKKNRDSRSINDDRQPNISRDDDLSRSGRGRSMDHDYNDRQDTSRRSDIERNNISRQSPGNRSEDDEL
jgi:hypothetical protein